MTKEYKATCPHCREDIIIEIQNNKVINIIHINEKISVSELANLSIEFG